MFRVLPRYTLKKAAEHCKSITIEELSARIAPDDHAATILIGKFKNLIAHTEAIGHSAFLIEWDDGLLTLIISHSAKNINEVGSYTLGAAYLHAAQTGDICYTEMALPPLSVRRKTFNGASND